jgi:Meiotically up-regulated gene 113
VPIQPPQASASTNSATRAQLSLLDGVSQETATESSAASGVVKLPEKKIRQSGKPLIAGNQNAVPTDGVYFLASMDRKRVKIGKSKNVTARIADLGHMNARGLILLAVIPGGYTHTEKWLHYNFKEQRTHGEWFVLTSELRAVIAAAQAGEMHVGLRASLHFDAIESEKRAAEKKAEAARPSRSHITYTPPPPKPKLKLKSFDDVVAAWLAMNGPTLAEIPTVSWDEFRDANNVWSDGPPLVFGAWVRRGTLRAYAGAHAFPPRFASSLCWDSPRARLADLIWYAIIEMKSEMAFAADSWSVSKLIAPERTRGSPGNARYFLPHLETCSGLRLEARVKDKCVCDTWSRDLPSDVEFVGRIGHHVWRLMTQWDLVRFDAPHERRCDCFTCNPEHEHHVTR